MYQDTTLQTRRRLHGRLWMSGTAFLVLGLMIAAVTVGRDGSGAVKSPPSPAVQQLQATGKAFAEVTKRVAPAVVFVEVNKKNPLAAGQSFPHGKLPFDDEVLKRFFGDRLPELKMPQRPDFAMGNGSGFIFTKEGYILTNNHVVQGADAIRVKLADGRKFDAKLVGGDAHTDVAVIKIEGDNLPVLALGNSDAIEVGEWVLAVGSPFGLPGTVTTGIVSAKSRSGVGITDYEDFIQTDAAINPGNSGGPLVNLNGDAIGINTAIFSRSGGYMGIGFAIPINMAREICDQLVANGAVSRGYLGIAIQQLTPELAKSFGLDKTEGILVGDVTKDSPAAAAQLKSGDVIVEFDGTEVTEMGDFRNRVAMAGPDHEIALTVIRDGQRMTVNVTTGERPVSEDVAVNSTENQIPSLGLTVEPLSEQLAERHGYQGEVGLVVTNVESGSLAFLAGLRPGMLIKEINRQPVRDLAEFQKQLDEGTDSVLLWIKEGQISRYIAMKLAG